MKDESKNTFWAVEHPPRPTLTGEATADVAVIGGGLAGVLIAGQLAERGLSVAVLEASTLGSGQTAGTTAKLTAQHGACYAPLAARMGEEAAARYAAANRRAIQDLRALVAARAIDCDWEESDAVLYSLTDRRRMEEEAAAERAAGLDAQFVTKTELPVRVAGAVKVTGQARFHPQKLLHALAAPLTVYEHTPVQTVEDGVLHTPRGRLRADAVVFACHYPFVNFPGYYFARLHQERSYVLALKGAPALNAMYLEVGDSGLSLRPCGDTLLFGGCGHRTGEEQDGHYDALRADARAWFPDATEHAYWSAQDCMTVDGLPYIGRFSKKRPNWYVATGFQKWGMSTAMVAANLLRELVGGFTPPEAALFDPARVGWRDAPAVLREGGHAARGLFRLWLTPAERKRVELAPGQGGIVRLDGRKVGLYRADDGQDYVVSPRCPHLGCALTWNPEERTWDCPCHGSRFDVTGKVLADPAQQPLAYTKRDTSAGSSRGE